MSDPTETEARRLTAEALGVEVRGAQRFRTGLQHFVYEVALANRRTVVMRMTRAVERAVARNALRLSRQLRPLGVPLPKLLAADVEAETPWLLLERLPGVDLGAAVDALPDARLEEIAGGVAAAQRLVATTPSAGRFGYAPVPDSAPYDRWSRVVIAHVNRSRERIAAAALFDIDAAERLRQRVEAMAGQLDEMPATPFLHDATTKNVIVTAEGGLSGVVDVDDLCFGDPRYVAALTHVALIANDLSRAYAACLMQAAGWRDDILFRLYIAAFLLDFMSEHGQRFNDNQRPSSPEARTRLLALYEAAWADL